MGRVKQKGKAGAAKAYVTRSAAVKKLQCSLADFRRLCILKGIFPREPRHRKKANKGSSAPTSFYYAKDIAYLAHEPVLKKLRDHKAFARKLSRALGRGEWSSAKSLEAHKPLYTLDHVIKERYPTFIDALRDIDDALCLIFLFANLPSNERIPPSLIENCTRLSNEWLLYVMRSQTLRKVFLSIKGVYYQADVMGQAITWLVPYMFTQNIPVDVDVRVMLTFLELYQTLLGFVFFKLYTDLGLIYPPPLDATKDECAAGVGAYSLQEKTIMHFASEANGVSTNNTVDVAGKTISGKDVRKTIKSIEATQGDVVEIVPQPQSEVIVEEEEEFIAQPSKSDATGSSNLPTLKSLMELPSSVNTKLFAPYIFFLSRETPRPLLEFVIRAFGGRVGWTPSQGGGSPIQENDEAITHVVVDRPTQAPPGSAQVTSELAEEGEVAKELRRRRKYVQPQWVVDCINKGKVLLEGPYERGKTLPPHLSPFGEAEGAYDPEEDVGHDPTGNALEATDEEVSEDEEGGDVKVTVVDPEDPNALRAAELEAEAAGVDYGTFEKAIKKQTKKTALATAADVLHRESDMKKMMLSRKKRKLYEKMKYTEEKKVREREVLLRRRDALKKEKKVKWTS